MVTLNGIRGSSANHSHATRINHCRISLSSGYCIEARSLVGTPTCKVWWTLGPVREAYFVSVNFLPKHHFPVSFATTATTSCNLRNIIFSSFFLSSEHPIVLKHCLDFLFNSFTRHLLCFYPIRYFLLK